MAANKGFGTTIAKGVTTIGTLTNITPPEVAADTIETTVLDSTSGFRTFIQGMKDGGEVSIQGYFDTADAGQLAVSSALTAGTVDSYTITFPSAIGATWTFDAVVTMFKTGEANIDDPLGFEATLKITGVPNLGTTASTGASALTFVQTDGTTALTAAALTPTYAIGTYFYAFTFTTQTSFKPKVTAASHTIKLYVDGVYSEALTSGTAGSAISISAGATKQIDVIVYEAGKTPKTYSIAVARTA